MLPTPLPLAPPFTTVAWSPDGRSIRLLDQRQLPERELYLEVRAIHEVVEAIRTLTVRGAPAIGVAAAMGLVVALEHELERSRPGEGTLRTTLAALAASLETARPTAVNLRWAVQRQLAVAASVRDEELLSALRHEATRILHEDRAMCLAIGQAGAPLISHGASILTHCNAGALATAGIGTALAPMYVAHAGNVPFRVFADETRPLLQGARLTAWELTRAGIPVTVLPDSAAASLLRTGAIQSVFVGADRIAANGDVANKIGTYPLALAARTHGVPFHVCAPWSTFDPAMEAGALIEIEQRERAELSQAGDRTVMPQHVPVYNPAFDVTPRELVTSYITDRGIITPPFH